MSDDKAAAPAEAAAPSAPKGPLILALVNTLAVLGAAGMLYYTKVLFKRPSITEETERARLEAEKAKPAGPLVFAPGQVTFDPMTVNVENYPRKPGDTEGTPHYVTMGFTLHIRDAGQKGVIDSVRPVVMDKLLAILAHKPIHELTTVQGRYVLRTQIIELVNGMTADLASYPHAVPAAAPAKKADDGHGGGGGEHGSAEASGGHGTGGHAEAASASGPPIRAVFGEGLVADVFFTQFIVQ